MVVFGVALLVVDDATAMAVTDHSFYVREMMYYGLKYPKYPYCLRFIHSIKLSSVDFKRETIQFIPPIETEM